MIRRENSTKSPPQKLQSLNAEEEDNARSPSLRGSRHAKVPKIPNNKQPFNTPLPVTRDRVPHSQPYYLSEECLLSIGDERHPWVKYDRKVSFSQTR